MSDAEYTIKSLRTYGAGERPWTVFPREARNLVEHVDHLVAENERLTALATRHETAFRRICDLLNHRVGSDPLHVAAVQAVSDFVMLGVQEAVAQERAAVVAWLRHGRWIEKSVYLRQEENTPVPAAIHDAADRIERGDHR